jgi:hypothetical protein
MGKRWVSAVIVGADGEQCVGSRLGSRNLGQVDGEDDLTWNKMVKGEVVKVIL